MVEDAIVVIEFDRYVVIYGLIYKYKVFHYVRYVMNFFDVLAEAVLN